MSLGRLEIRGLCRKLLSGNEWWEYLNLSEEELSIFEIGVNTNSALFGYGEGRLPSGEFSRYLNLNDKHRSLFERGRDLPREELEGIYDIDWGEWTAAYQEDIYIGGRTISHSGPGLMVVKDPNDLVDGDKRYEESKRMAELYPEHAWIFRYYYEHYNPSEWERLNDLLVA